MQQDWNKAIFTKCHLSNSIYYTRRVVTRQKQMSSKLWGRKFKGWHVRKKETCSKYDRAFLYVCNRESNAFVDL